MYALQVYRGLDIAIEKFSRTDTIMELSSDIRATNHDYDMKTVNNMEIREIGNDEKRGLVNRAIRQ